MSHVIGGILIPESFLYSDWFTILAAFVGINTLVYVTLAIGKILPRVHPTHWVWVFQGKPSRRKETRSIYPDADSTVNEPAKAGRHRNT